MTIHGAFIATGDNCLTEIPNGRSEMAGSTLSMKLVAAAGIVVAALALGIVLAATSGTSSTSSGFPRGSEPVTLDPADFSANVDNSRWPMTVGSRWVYRVT